MNSTNEKKLTLVLGILEQAIEISSNSIIDIFVDFSSHVNLLSVKVYVNGWDYDSDFDFNEYVYINDKNCIEKLNYIDSYLKRLKRKV